MRNRELLDFPQMAGMYDPENEKDSCGIGFVANIKGEKSHQIVRDGLTILENLTHRGATGADPETGDGAGILIQIPDKFFRKVCQKIDITLPECGNYAIGVVFLPPNEADSSAIEKTINGAIEGEGLEVLGWRNVPIDKTIPGIVACKGMPTIKQVFIKNTLGNVEIFERKVYTVRRVISQNVAKLELKRWDLFHIPSFSSKTIVYKGMLIAYQLPKFYKDLSDKDMVSALSLVHQRYSTNTFPSWTLAQPFHFLCHNGEINTLRGNVNWMLSRENLFKSDRFGDDIKKLLPIIRPLSSDSFSFDNALELLVMNGYSLPHAMMMLVPEAWEKDVLMDKEKKAFYQYSATKMEPWDGPAAIAFSDGTYIGATLDRNGLRPARYIITKDDRIVLGSESGVLDVPPENIKETWRLQPGKMLLCDLKNGLILNDDEVKSEIIKKKPYGKWIEENLIKLDDIEEVDSIEEETVSLKNSQILFGYNVESIDRIIAPMATNGVEPLASMGADTPPAILSDKPQLLYNYFKQLFAQVTNPPIDPIREELVMSLTSYLGPEGNLLEENPEDCQRLKVNQPILNNKDMAKLKSGQAVKSCVSSTLFNIAEGRDGFTKTLEKICNDAVKSAEGGCQLLILSDRGANAEKCHLPALLAVGAVHHHLIKNGIRGKIGLAIETGEAFEVHHHALLLGYGVGAINPYIVFDTIASLLKKNLIKGHIDLETAKNHYIKACGKGLHKIFSKMGISTLQSYMGAQIFEAVGLSNELIDKYFTHTPSKIKGIGLKEIAEETMTRHRLAFDSSPIPSGGEYAWRKEGEYHMFNPDTVVKLQLATRKNDYKIFKEYTSLLDEKAEEVGTFRGLLELDLKEDRSIPLDEVESVENIVKRFNTGAMSYGAISKEVHETLAIAMNRLGARSNTGEGGEAYDRFKPDANGDLRRSAIKQVASGRFGVTANYLSNADEIQIKMAQGAKPGEGGQLPGHKVNEIIGQVRHTTPGVGLISPPPHHDIYSIEDLAQLIFDLKNSNPKADISVKLVSEVGVGTIAAGVAKGKADKVLISGCEGGTGASPMSSVMHAGLPLELGLSETQQTLILNDLRGRIKLVADGQIKTGWDIIVAALLGADEYGFATSALIVCGCVMARKCHMNTCPVGVATQDERLRKFYHGDPDYVVNFFKFLAEEVREYMAKLGYRTMDEMIGQVQNLKQKKNITHWKRKTLDLKPILHKPEVAKDTAIRFTKHDGLNLDNILDAKLIKLAKEAIENQKETTIDISVRNIDRTVGTMLGHEITKRYADKGLPKNTLTVNFKGTAGQSFGTFLPKGVTFVLDGDANDYIGKGLSGGNIIVKKPEGATFKAEDNIVIGNTSLYGAIEGKVFLNGIAGERFAVRNSGAIAVVEGVGDHGCEYMTGGRIVIIGNVGRNFGAGMSGGIAYVFDESNQFNSLCNKSMVSIEELVEDEDIDFVKGLIEEHLALTGSKKAKEILDDWKNSVSKFAKVYPNDYKRVLEEIKAKNAAA